MTTRGVSTVTTGVVAVSTGVNFLSLVVLSDLDSLLDVVEFNANNLLAGDTVYGGGDSVLGGDAVSVSVSVSSVSARVFLVLDLLRQEDVLNFVEEMRVYEVTFAFGVADGHGVVVAAAAEGAQGDGGRGGGVAVAYWRLSHGATQQGEGDL